MKRFIFMVLAVLFPLPLYAGELQLAGSELNTLQGKWEGEAFFRNNGSAAMPTTLTIFNNYPPYHGVLTGVYRHPFENGELINGKLVIKWGEVKTVILSLTESESGGRMMKGEITWSVPKSKETPYSKGFVQAPLAFTKRTPTELLASAPGKFK